MNKKQKIIYLIICLLVVLIPGVLLVCLQKEKREPADADYEDALIAQSSFATYIMNDMQTNGAKSNQNSLSVAATNSKDAPANYIQYISVDYSLPQNSIVVPVPCADMAISMHTDLMQRQVYVLVQNSENDKRDNEDISFWQENPIRCNIKLKSFQIQNEGSDGLKFIFTTEEFFEYELINNGEQSVCLVAQLPSKMKDKIVVLDPYGGGENKGICVFEDGIVVNIDDEKNVAKDLDKSKILLSESDIAYRIASLVKEKLEKENIHVYITRDESQNPSISDRLSFINNLGEDFFVGLNCSLDENSSVYGLKAIYNENYFIPDFSGADLANILLEKTSEATDEKNLGLVGNAKSQELVLHATLPAVEIDIGYLTNKQEQKLLQKDEYLQRVADGIAAGIVEAYKEIDK